MTRVTSLMLSGWLAAAPASAFTVAEQPTAEVDQILEQARREIREFEKAGGRRDDPKHPVAAWVEKLWAVRERHPGTPAAGRAAAEAIHLLVHAERMAEVEARASRLPPSDPAWAWLGPFLGEAAAQKNDYRFLVERLRSAIGAQADPAARAKLHLQLGLSLRKTGDKDGARAALKAAAEAGQAAPEPAREARTALYELDNLGYGQPAPAFAGTARDGSRVALQDFRDRALVLVFWAST